MGVFKYSSVVGPKPTVDRVTRVLKLVCPELRIEQIQGVPIDKHDNRLAKWAFYRPQDDTLSDCSFAISLLDDGRLEFKVPRTCYDEHYDLQQVVRRKLVAKLNEEGQAALNTP